MANPYEQSFITGVFVSSCKYISFWNVALKETKRRVGRKSPEETKKQSSSAELPSSLPPVSYKLGPEKFDPWEFEKKKKKEKKVARLWDSINLSVGANIDESELIDAGRNYGFGPHFTGDYSGEVEIAVWFSSKSRFSLGLAPDLSL